MLPKVTEHFKQRLCHQLKIKAVIGKYDEPLAFVKKRKLKWVGHEASSSGLAKAILQGTVQRERRKGRQKKRWEDHIKEWT